MEITRDKTYKLDFTNTDILRNERYGNYLVELQGASSSQMSGFAPYTGRAKGVPGEVPAEYGFRRTDSKGQNDTRQGERVEIFSGSCSAAECS